MPDSKIAQLLKFCVYLFITVVATGTNVLLAADTTAPITTAQKTPASPNGNNNWYTVPVQFTLTATDLESGVAQIRYRIDSGSWQTSSFEDTLNLAPNPSFEDPDPSSSAGLDNWIANPVDSDTSYMQDQSEFFTGFDISSAKISTTGSGWHGINHSDSFAVAIPYANMSASVWVKSENVTNSAGFKVYAVSPNSEGQPIVFTQIGQSPTVTGTADWTRLNLNFVVNVVDAVGIYIDLGIDGTGTVWFDAVTLSDSLMSAQTTFTVGSDGSHTVSYYSVDRANNTETYSCSGTIKNCTTFQIDQTPPGGWNNAGAFRGIFGSNYQLWVYTNVLDPTSGISTFTDKYQIQTELHPGEFGNYSNILSCSSTWQPNQWVILISPPFFPGSHSAYLLTPKTSFCNSNWSACKRVRFYSRDMAGNVSTKDYCINGPWIRIRGEGIVRSETGIDMVAEAQGDNTDGLIETGNNTLDFFSSTKDWVLKSSVSPDQYDYNIFDARLPVKTEASSVLPTSSGVYLIDSDFDVNSSAIPGNYDSENFAQIIFIDGDLTISNNIVISNSSAVLFIVSGDVKITKSVTQVNAGIITDGTFYTAHDVADGEDTELLTLKGLYHANKFDFQRTLQGTDNTVTPSEDFIYEPKYLVKLREYLGEDSVSWSKVD